MGQEKGLADLQVWQRSLRFAKQIHELVLSRLPDQEKWALTNQLRRASQSIAANIAEGCGRYYYQEGVRFCYIARGSLEETFSHLTLAHELDYLPEDTYTMLIEELREISRMLNGYIAHLKRSRRGAHEPGAPHAAREESPSYELTNDSLPPNS